MSANDGGPVAKFCPYCGLPFERKSGNQWLCAKHYRFRQMRSAAKRNGKAVPSFEFLESIATLKCGDCGIQMNWLAVANQTTVATLQHYRDGTIGIVCRSCNTRHAFMPDDSYRALPKDHKYCAKCKTQKHISMFFSDNGNRGQFKRKSHCASCSTEKRIKWQNENREIYNAQQRAWRAKQAARKNEPVDLTGLKFGSIKP